MSSTTTTSAPPVPPSEAYRFRPHHTAIILIITLLLDLPFLIDRLMLNHYDVPAPGGILVTGASTGIGHDGAVALAKKYKGLCVCLCV
jgi:hypothetical protein